MPRPLDPVRRSLRRLGLALAVSAVAGTGGCDEKLQNQLKNASARQSARDAKKAEAEALRARGIGPAPAVSPEIARAIKVVRTSDYDFLVRKKGAARKKKGDDPPKRHNGFDFAATLESKTRWLGRGINDLPTWLDEIGSSTFFAHDEYLVRLPDGREMSFRTWLLEELAALPPDLTPDLVPESETEADPNPAPAPEPQEPAKP